VIRAILAARRVGARRTRSDLELAFVELLNRAGLPRPETNLHAEARGRLYEADCVWGQQRLIVELDSRTHHATTAAFEDDRARDRALSVAGWRTVRVTWRHLHGGAADLEADLWALLSPRRSPPGLSGRTAPPNASS
jgi:very-short-patch-repair endonuclease